MYIYFIIIFLLYILLKYFYVFLLNIISYVLALFLIFFFLNETRNLIKNLNCVFKDISNFSKFKILLKSSKNLTFNILIILIQNIFGDNYLINYYNIKNYNIPKKCQLILAHYGLFYDFVSGIKIFNKNLAGIFKGKFNHINNKNFKLFKHNMVDYKLLSKYFIIDTPIDQKSNDKTIVSFLNKQVKFHSKLVDFSLNDNRNLYFYYVDIGWNSLKLNIIKINTKDKKLVDIIQNIADMMTKIILKNPDQYLWLHDRFNVKKTL